MHALLPVQILKVEKVSALFFLYHKERRGGAKSAKGREATMEWEPFLCNLCNFSPTVAVLLLENTRRLTGIHTGPSLTPFWFFS